MAREKKADKLIRALAVAERMNSHYGEAACALHYTTPFTLTIAVLLSAQTTDAGVNRVNPSYLRNTERPKPWHKPTPKTSHGSSGQLGFTAPKQKTASPARR